MNDIKSKIFVDLQVSYNKTEMCKDSCLKWALYMALKLDIV